MTVLQIWTAAMQWTSLYVLASLAILVTGSTPFPVGSAGAALFLPLAVSQLSKVFRVRRITSSSAYLGTLLLSVQIAVSMYGKFSPVSIPTTITWSQENPVAAVAVTILTILFWVQGFRVGMDTETVHPRTIRRFDTGVGIVTVVALVRMGFGLPDETFVHNAVLYVLVGSISLAISRSISDGISDVNGTGGGWSTAHRSSAGVLVTIGASMLLLGGVLYSFYPLMTRAADGAYRSIRRGLVAIEPWIVRILRAAFGRGLADSSGTVPSGSGEAPRIAVDQIVEPAAFMVLMGKILAWGFAILLIVLVVWVLALRLYGIAKSLWARPGGTSPPPSVGDVLRSIVRMVHRYLMRLLLWPIAVYRRFFAPKRRTPPAVSAFRRLTRWGRHAGVRRERYEALGEYGRRLIRYAPDKTRSIETLVDAIQSAHYGAASLTPTHVEGIDQALRDLGNPIVRRFREVVKTRYPFGPDSRTATKHPDS